MVECRDIFIKYLENIGFNADSVIDSFDIYYRELVEINQYINLFSRKMNVEDIWQRHFLDSISIFEVCKDWEKKNILDFGTGGGLPGLPIKILEQSCKMTLLDSTQKKIESLKSIVSKLKLEDKGMDCFVPRNDICFICARIEGKEMEYFYGQYDVIVCRAVKITPQISASMKKLLNKKGRIYLYKSGNYDDVKLFKDFHVYKLNSQIFGERNIVEIKNG